MEFVGFILCSLGFRFRGFRVFQGLGRIRFWG